MGDSQAGAPNKPASAQEQFQMLLSKAFAKALAKAFHKALAKALASDSVEEGHSKVFKMQSL